MTVVVWNEIINKSDHSLWGGYHLLSSCKTKKAGATADKQAEIIFSGIAEVFLWGLWSANCMPRSTSVSQLPLEICGVSRSWRSEQAAYWMWASFKKNQIKNKQPWRVKVLEGLWLECVHVHGQSKRQRGLGAKISCEPLVTSYVAFNYSLNTVHTCYT